MTRRQPALIAGAITVALLAAACGQSAHQATATLTQNKVTHLSLATSVATPSRSWAVLAVGDSASLANNFWQLLGRPEAGGNWRLITPPGVASNGGLAIAPTGPNSLLAGFLPSQELLFTPLATTANAGAAWSQGVLNAHLASSPDALAASSSKELALAADGTLRQSTNGGKAWRAIATKKAVATTQAGRRCNLTGLTGTAFSPAGDPMLTGDCTANGQPGIFTLASGTWQPAGPDLSGVQSSQPVTTLSISTSAGTTVALLAIGTGPATSLVAARYAGDPARWTLSHPFTVGSEKVMSVSAGGNGAVAVLLSGRRGLLLAGAAADWRRLPELPPATEALATGPGTTLQALTGSRTAVGVWALNAAGSAWAQVQHLPVPVQFGSSS